MKKFIIIFLGLLIINNTVIATQTDILETQKESLGISSFLKTAQKYTSDSLEDVNLNEIFNETIAGNIKTNYITKIIFKIIGKETKQAISNIIIILVIVVINSILTTISESLGNKSVSQTAYFVEYIIIVTLVLNNFAGIIGIVKETITNLVGFLNTLIPLLIALMLSTRFYSICRDSKTYIIIFN